MPIRLLLALCLCLAVPARAAEAPCGTPDGLCEVAGGSYRMALPAGAGTAPVPALVYLHGWGQSAAAVMGNARLRAAAASRGMALVAPEGLPRPGRTQRDWAVPDGLPSPRDDLAFFAAIRADLAKRGIDTGRLLLSGFSRGGSMVWAVACEVPDFAFAYAPLAGAFWEPLPPGCEGPVRLLHTHGWTDRVVPIEGRPLGGGRLVQGDLFESLAILRETMGCDARQPDAGRAEDSLWRRSWTGCSAGGRIDLVLHPGGHGPYPGWIEAALDWFDARLAEAGAAPLAPAMADAPAACTTC